MSILFECSEKGLNGKVIGIKSMKIAIFSHCTIDEISQNNVVETAGGPACYCGLTAKNMKFEIDLHTKVGADFMFRTDLEKKRNFPFSEFYRVYPHY